MKSAAAFWARVDKSGPVPAHRPDLGPCWLWQGARNTQGRGKLRWGRQYFQAHAPVSGHAADNMRDAAAKGRLAVKLTPEQVREIRSGPTNRTAPGLAARFGVSRQAIRNIQTGATRRYARS